MQKNLASIIIALIVIGGAIFYLESEKPKRNAGDETPIALMGKEEKQALYEPAKEISTPDGFINTTQAAPITIGEFVGKKIVLVDFWTYSCINCQRTTPYLNAWYEKYRDKGLEIIGIHTPEFEFEKKYENVLAAVNKLEIKYPVVLDNDYSTWAAYKNRYWPHKYLIDIDGFIVYDHIGEGAYEETEMKIQELLRERMAVLGIKDEISEDIARPGGIRDIDSSVPRSPEIYFGAGRNQYLANGKSGLVGSQHFEEPGNIELNKLYLVGDWDIQDEYAEYVGPGLRQGYGGQGKIIFRYRGQNVYMVATHSGLSSRVLRDGKPLEPLENGGDTKADRLYVGPEAQLYHVINDRSGYGEHTLEIIIETPGLQAFTFTFG